MSSIPSVDLTKLANDIKAWGKALGFQQVGISDLDISRHKVALTRWLENGYQGQMAFFEKNLEQRLNPDRLVAGTLRIISVRMDYLPEDAMFAQSLEDPNKAYISRYALGRDYHKLMRKRLKKLAQQIAEVYQDLEYRPFVDSAPVLEHAYAEKSGIGWTGKHSLTLHKSSGSWFFLGELFINVPLPIDTPIEDGCGSCTACLSICPTNAIVAPYTVNANKCISYLTIEHEGVIPVEYRQAMGNRIYGCDDCQLVCPWNKQAEPTQEEAFNDRLGLKNADLLELFAWSEDAFLHKFEGSPIRRIGYQKWKRNISVALGNAPYSETIINALSESIKDMSHSEVLVEHFSWALSMQLEKKALISNAKPSVTNRQQSRLVRIVKKGLPRDA
ncbi:tRNA epoxyqueuosine(34) reductase QueG [Agaribacter flavus]|uniref:Epoxyqueuosine reductase n=1 Tax=Agaribacter flavus TaxID=1902781 RepID=A0ABV7FPR1_9ALTE